jgi:hypothetical protein
MTVDCCNVGQTQPTIDTLPDDALLYVFDFYVAQASEVEAWHTLIHVCRGWRNLALGSPRHLNLRIACTTKSPVLGKLDIWPPLPIVISGSCESSNDFYNVHTALRHHDRVCQIKIKLSYVLCKPQFLIPSLEKPFPVLTDFELIMNVVGPVEPFNPDPSKFLGGGSAHLRSLTLGGIWIPGLLKLLLSTPNLVILRLDQISGVFRPDEIVTVLSTLTGLEELDFSVELDRPPPELESRHLPLLQRTILPSLAILTINGTIETLENFMALIDTPLLVRLHIRMSSFSDQDIILDTPQLFRFIGRTPKLRRQPSEVKIGFPPGGVRITFFFPSSFHIMLSLEISCAHPERRFPSLAQFCRLSPFPIHILKTLCIGGGQVPQHPQRNHAEDTRWLELLRQFSGVKNLFLGKEIAVHIVHALQEHVGERAMEVLPILENVFIDEFELSGPLNKIIKEFVASRQLTGHPITISRGTQEDGH